MDSELILHLGRYYYIYEAVVSGHVEVDDLKKYLMEAMGKPATSTRRHIEEIMKTPGLFLVSENQININKDLVVVALKEIMHLFHIREQELQEGDPVEIDANSKGVFKADPDLEMENSELKRQLDNLKKQIVEMQCMEKVLLLDSIELDQKSVGNDWVFLHDVEYQIDIENTLRSGRKERLSFMKEVNETIHEEESGSFGGRELNKKNYLKRVFQHVVTDRLLKGRYEEIKAWKAAENECGLQDEKSKGMESYDQVQEFIERNRLGAINNLLKNNRLSNQEKLGLYAFFSRFHNTDMEAILNYAGEYCLNANWLIMLLEESDGTESYEKIKGMLQQLVKSSEVRMKLDLAKELIEGQWYVTADYCGRKTKFQMVPVDELQNLKAIVDSEVKHPDTLWNVQVNCDARVPEKRNRKNAEPLMPSHPDYIPMYVGQMEEYEGDE